MVLTKVPGTHGQHGHVHGETAGQEGCAGDEHPGTEQKKADCETAHVVSELLTDSPETYRE